MADGRYRVTTGRSGERYLYLFPPNGAVHRALLLDEDEDGTLDVLVMPANRDVVSLTPSSFVTFLDELERDQTTEPGGTDPKGGPT